MTHEELFAMLEAKTFVDLVYGREDNDEAYNFKKELWMATREFCSKMKVEGLPNAVILQLRKENKL